MALNILRALFVLLMAAAGWFFLTNPKLSFGENTWMALAIALVLGVLFVCIDILAPRRKLALLSGTFIGLLVGLFAAYAMSFIVSLIVDNVTNFVNSRYPTELPVITIAAHDNFVRFANIIVGLICCYLA